MEICLQNISLSCVGLSNGQSNAYNSPLVLHFDTSDLTIWIVELCRRSILHNNFFNMVIRLSSPVITKSPRRSCEITGFLINWALAYQIDLSHENKHGWELLVKSSSNPLMKWTFGKIILLYCLDRKVGL